MVTSIPQGEIGTMKKTKLIKRAFGRARAELSGPGVSDAELLEACEEALDTRLRTMLRRTAEKAVDAELDRLAENAAIRRGCRRVA